jgi:hypothetical protein
MEATGMSDWKYADWDRLLQRLLLGLIWPPAAFSLVCDIVVGLLFLQAGLAANARSPHPHPEYRKRWIQLYFGKSATRSVR